MKFMSESTSCDPRGVVCLGNSARLPFEELEKERGCTSIHKDKVSCLSALLVYLACSAFPAGDEKSLNSETGEKS